MKNKDAIRQLAQLTEVALRDQGKYAHALVAKRIADTIK